MSGEVTFTMKEVSRHSITQSLLEGRMVNREGARAVGVNPIECIKCDRVLDGIFTLQREKGSYHEMQKFDSRL
ncbi:MAG: hypothetical protein ABID54_01625 [Pseudomonadota bacterium]